MSRIRNLVEELLSIDLAVVIILTALLIPLAIFTEGAARIIIGLPFLLFLPGYAFIAVLFPKKDDLETIERAALSLGLSIAIVPLIGLILNYTWEISIYPILISMATFIAATSAATIYRRRRLPPEQRYEPRVNLEMPRWGGGSRLDRALSVLLAVSILAAIGALVYVVASPKVGERFTEFYILGPDGIAENYPTELILGEEAALIVGIVNHEQEDTIYDIEITFDGDKVAEFSSIALANEGEWEQEVTFTPMETGDAKKAEFLLYKNGGGEPYLSLHLWMDVNAP